MQVTIERNVLAELAPPSHGFLGNDDNFGEVQIPEMRVTGNEDYCQVDMITDQDESVTVLMRTSEFYQTAERLSPEAVIVTEAIAAKAKRGQVPAVVAQPETIEVETDDLRWKVTKGRITAA